METKRRISISLMMVAAVVLTGCTSSPPPHTGAQDALPQLVCEDEAMLANCQDQVPVLDLSYVDCFLHVFSTQQPVDEVQRLLPKGFVAYTGLATDVGPVDGPVAGILVSTWNCDHVVWKSRNLAFALTWGMALVPVKVEKPQPGRGMYLLELYLSHQRVPDLYEALENHGFPLIDSEVAVESSETVAGTQGKIQITVDGGVRYAFEDVLRAAAPVEPLEFDRKGIRAYHVPSKSQDPVWYEDAPGEGLVTISPSASLLTVSGGAWSNLDTGTHGLIPGHARVQPIRGNLTVGDSSEPSAKS